MYGMMTSLNGMVVSMLYMDEKMLVWAVLLLIYVICVHVINIKWHTVGNSQIIHSLCGGGANWSFYLAAN